MRIGILTGGGDCPGLNAVIRAVVKRAVLKGHEVYGLKKGWRGLLNKDYEKLTLDSISGILHKGGTILGSSRTNVYKEENGEAVAKRSMEEMGLDALVAIGGEDTLGVASKLYKAGVNVVGVPKTIDNDLNATDYTFGFDTAVNIATEAIDRLHTTAESHNRVIVVEVMGRHAGWIALHSGIAGGADIILIPEKPFDIEEVCQSLKNRHARGKSFSIVCIAEGAKIKTEEATDKDGSFVLSSLKKDSFGHVALGGIGNIIAEEIEKRTGFETRATILGHIQRGGTPSAFDRVLGTRFGVFAADLVDKGEFGKMASLQGKDIVSVNIEDAVGVLKTVDDEIYEMATTFFG
ncbi:MAG: 6-phosphofructokinase [Bacteroidetes bacterium]|nr:6-phosphofructokinase [Bacteroidota bacterium]MBU1678337.1 6-phosphofructokinase [Bacteroidota bacterium]MBU2508525.1 6-phosphofructokinase [Bacteroidota bacterium]